MRCFDDERQRTGPIRIGEFEKTVWHFARETHRLFDRIDENRERFGLRAAFGAEYPFNGGQIKRIGGQAIKRVGRNAYNFATFDESRSIFHNVFFGRFG